MSRSNLNIEELEVKFDEILASINDQMIDEWICFDEEQLQLEKLKKGMYTPTHTADCLMSKPSNKSNFKVVTFVSTVDEFNFAS